MKRKKRKNFSIFIILFFVFFLIFFIFFYKFKNIYIEPKKFSFYIKPYFENKTPYEIYLNFKKLMLDFPEIKKLKIKQNIFKKELKIEIETTQIIAKICDQKNCFYLDNTSRIILPKFIENKNLLLIYSELPIEKDSLLNPELTNLFSKIFEYANLKLWILKEIKIHTNFDVSVIDEKNREFLFDPSRNIEEQIKKLHLFLTKNFQGARIDLRIHKKIYFK